MRVRVARFRPFYAGLFASMGLLVATPFIVAAWCWPRLGVGGWGCSPAVPAALLSATLAVIVAHELVHYLVARLLGVPGARLRVEPRIAAIMLDYDYMTPNQYLVVALAPQLLTPLLVALGLWLGGLPGLSLCVAAAANLAGGAPDVVNALYFRLVHGSASRFMLLYRWDGRVDGGVVEYPDGSIVVYVI